MMDFFFYLALFYFGLNAGYLLLLTLSACLFRKRSQEHAARLSVAVVIPAHNEETEIADAIRSIKSCDYPENKVKIFVIADNCSDATAKHARDASASVFERQDKVHVGKGAALHWFLTEQREVYQDFDVVTIIDADSRPAPQYLKEISASLSVPDIEVVQGYYTVSNPDDNWMTALSLAALSIVHHLRPAGREQLGGTAGLKGNGMAFHRPVLERLGWPCNSIVEDLEYSNYLLSKGIRVHYNPDAVIFGEMPTRKDQAAPQRQRWEEGRFRLAFMNIPALFLDFLTRWKFAFLDAIFDLLILPLSLLLALNAVLFSWAWFAYPDSLVQITLGSLAIFTYVLVGIALKRPPRYVWVALLASPAFILFKLGVYAKMLLLRPGSGWTRTARNRELSDS